jgi:hypothetical protein
MTWGELKAANVDTPDEAEVYIDDERLIDEEEDIPGLNSCELDEDGDVILIPEG